MQQAINSPSGPAMDVTSLGIQLTRTGDNDSPFLSQDGNQFAFISRNRKNHSQPQVYLFDLTTLKEKRVTYQDGDCRDPILLNDGQTLVYASTTDELKERPILFRKDKTLPPLPPTELYLSDISGSEILRLTHREGFDGLAWPLPKRPESLVYSILDGKNLEVRQINLKSKKTIPIMAKRNRSVESLRPSLDGNRWAWIERSPTAETQVFVGQLDSPKGKDRILTLPKGDYKELVWLGEHKLILNAKIFKEFYQLYSLDLISECLTPLMDSESDLFSPRVHHGKQGLIFSSSSNGHSQIFYKSIATSGQCLKWQEQIKN